MFGIKKHSMWRPLMDRAWGTGPGGQGLGDRVWGTRPGGTGPGDLQLQKGSWAGECAVGCRGVNHSCDSALDKQLRKQAAVT